MVSLVNLSYIPPFETLDVCFELVCLILVLGSVFWSLVCFNVSAGQRFSLACCAYLSLFVAPVSIPSLLQTPRGSHVRPPTSVPP